MALAGGMDDGWLCHSLERTGNQQGEDKDTEIRNLLTPSGQSPPRSPNTHTRTIARTLTHTLAHTPLCVTRSLRLHTRQCFVFHLPPEWSRSLSPCAPLIKGPAGLAGRNQTPVFGGVIRGVSDEREVRAEESQPRDRVTTDIDGGRLSQEVTERVE